MSYMKLQCFSALWWHEGESQGSYIAKGYLKGLFCVSCPLSTHFSQDGWEYGPEGSDLGTGRVLSKTGQVFRCQSLGGTAGGAGWEAAGAGWRSPYERGWVVERLSEGAPSLPQSCALLAERAVRTHHG